MELYPLVAEIKPEGATSGDTQHTEQMIGLFKRDQKVMVGILLAVYMKLMKRINRTTTLGTYEH